MTTLDILRDAQGEILSLQSYINQLEPKAIAFDLLVRTHLGRVGGDVAVGGAVANRRAVVNELEDEIVNIQLEAAANANEAAAKEAEKAKKAKAKKPHKPRTPRIPPTPAVEGEQGNGGGEPGPQGGAVEGSQPTANDPGANAPTPIDSGRRRRGIFGGAPAAAG